MNDIVISDFVVPANHPALAGHFPGQPVVPAVLMLDLVLAAIGKREPVVLHSIPGAKFLSPVLPDERIELRLRFAAAEVAKLRVSFQGLRGQATVFEGSFVVSQPDPAP